MKIIVTGAKGQLGYDVLRELKYRNYKDSLGIGSEELDITDNQSVKEFMKQEKPDVIIHCAAYTAVDKAEDNQEQCIDVNVNGTKYLVDAAKTYAAKFVYISTDYVFSGDKVGEYDTIDSPNPISVYGKSKYLGELETLTHDKYFIIRISWVFGKNGNNFIKTMLKLGNELGELNVVSNQIGSPTYTRDLSKLIVDMVETDKYGIYHATNEGICSWYEFSKEIFDQTGIKINVKPISASQYPTKAKRPMNSSMNKQNLIDNGFKTLSPWQDAVKRYLKEIEVV